MRVLLLEDDLETAAAIGRGLTREGFEVAVAHDVERALALIGEREFEVAVLDVVVPGGDGFDVLARLRGRGVPTGVLMVTARGSVADRVKGLERGADDYLPKPFSFAELVARVRALGRRSGGETRLLRVGAVEIDFLRRTAQAGERRIELTPTEFSLLAALFQAAGHPRTRSDLLREVWGYDFDPGTNVVDVHVNRLRKKLQDAGVLDLVRTIRGLGYAAG